MKKTLSILLLLVTVASCDPADGVDRVESNQELLQDKLWKTYAYSENGTPEPFVVSQEPTFHFRSDGKLYFSQINPVYRDTFNFSFPDPDNVRLTKPQVPGYFINLKIDRLTDYDFDFTGSNSQNADVSVYKTQKQ